MLLGTAYYPEHWPEEQIIADAELMKKAGINVVRMAEFSWAKLESKQDHFNFSWLDRSIEILAEKGIKTILGTPSATPPKWIVDSCPDTLKKNKLGIPRGFGSRRHYCFNSPSYRNHVQRIVNKMAIHYQSNPNIIVWQVDNELGEGNTTHCYCENCLSEFKKWLLNKYENIDNLNSQWGTVFWSQIYSNWDEIILPAFASNDEGNPSSPFIHNPGLLLDYFRFSSDSAISFLKFQADEIKKYAKQPVTHNFMCNYSHIDYYQLGKEVDFVSLDNYPLNTWSRYDVVNLNMNLDMFRSIKKKNFWIMEQQSGPLGWNVISSTPEPGCLRLWTYQAIAHGAEAIVYFNWRACPFGTEEYCYGILDHDGVPRRRYEEIKNTIEESHSLSSFFEKAETVSEAGILKAYDKAWSLEFQPLNPDFRYYDIIQSYYQALAGNYVNVDFVFDHQNLRKYKILILPSYVLLDEKLAAKLTEYVQNGGCLITNFFTGTKEPSNSVIKTPFPGLIKDICGIEIEDFDCLTGKRTVEINGVMGKAKASIWCDIIKTETAETIARYSEGYYKGKTAVSRNHHGKGYVYYSGCNLDKNGMDQFMKIVMDEAAIDPILPYRIEGIDIVRKEIQGKQYLMVLNHNPSEVILKLGKKYESLLQHKEIGEIIEILPYGVDIIQQCE